MFIVILSILLAKIDVSHAIFLERTLFKFTHDDIQSRIVGGVDAEDGEFPWYAHAAKSQLCGGTLIHEDIGTCMQVEEKR